MEKTAEEMFKELGFECVNEKFLIVFKKKYIDYLGNSCVDEIKFFNTSYLTNTFINGNPHNLFRISLRLHKAITKKMEELGWL